MDLRKGGEIHFYLFIQRRRSIFSSEGALKIGSGPIWACLCWCSLGVYKKGQDMPKLCDGDNGKKNTSAIGIGHIALYIVRLGTYAFKHNIAAKKWGGGGGYSVPVI